ncbi:hypothetical protein HME01_29090 [Vreelandella aquamarina]|uniref:Uncharacterized protein n=1 Tax=Vreelandella aquamarina TaxID=77097 RepID=A0A1N6EMY3_9GAMM|nr:hypothetical protein [Halomonas meridiana]GED47057.1 hypothetical protein HME01_29090 [Halomonas meridiana]SIN84442.1 hypothetical protein SAMN05878249_3750 [Halomonas meridiana]SIN88142.1 hypothetical protein SAMN05878438_3797 [Halomonas meridiana]SIO51166.1 hypothetical protein SAMN05878442_3779 [Halomonas meridiana]
MKNMTLFLSRIVGTTLVTAMIVALSLLLIDGKKIKAEIDRDLGARLCPLSHPIYVEIYNYSFKKITGANFSMVLKNGDESGNLLHRSSRIFDKEVSPFGKEYDCYSDEYIHNYIHNKTVINVNEKPYNYNANEDIEDGENESSTARINFSEAIGEANALRDFIKSHSVEVTETYYIN